MKVHLVLLRLWTEIVRIKMITLKARKLNSFAEKSMGLMGKMEPENIYFETRWGIHTFFMNFPIDVLVLDKNFKVVSLSQNLKPGSIMMWNPKYYRVLELTSGTIQKMKIRQLNEISII